MTDTFGLLDTSAVIDLESLKNAYLPTFGKISAITCAELSIGPLSAQHATEKLNRIRKLWFAMNELEVLTFGIPESKSYGTLFEKLLPLGVKARGSRSLDLMIAATALAHQLPLYTRNAKDFASVNDLVEIVAV